MNHLDTIDQLTDRYDADTCPGCGKYEAADHRADPVRCIEARDLTLIDLQTAEIRPTDLDAYAEGWNAARTEAVHIIEALRISRTLPTTPTGERVYYWISLDATNQNGFPAMRQSNHDRVEALHRQLLPDLATLSMDPTADRNGWVIDLRIKTTR